MKLHTLIWLEGYKQKKGLIWLFLLVIPAGTTMAMFLDFQIRYDYLLDTVRPGHTSWDLLLMENHRVLGWGMFLPMFVGIIYALLYQVEESRNSWKQLLSLPVRREEFYLAKFVAGWIFSVLLIVLNVSGLILVGFIMDFPEAMEWKSYSIYAGKQIVLILAVAGLHNWLSFSFKNSVIGIVIGFAGVILSSIVIFMFPEWVKIYPYAYTFFTDGYDGGSITEMIFNNFIMLGVFFGLGLWQFKRRDVL
ncbi:ABC transporter permease [Bacillus sp. FJAT-27251]|uniref:ABC transporter permease n=1 Tax=Bacillus sp. FJAT-27251 TaxID=1684142 RepID=UPI0006A76F69|nr:ABC transporter permease [Bacillus sp. FJAT-27251]